MPKSAKMTVSVPPELIAVADGVAKEKKISRSKVVSMCLRELAEKRIHEQMVEGYIALADEHRRVAEDFFEAQVEALPEWNDDAGNS